MIELDDPITNLEIGLDEYVVLNALEVRTVRHILLLDVERILSIKPYGRTVGERIQVWQKLLRKYLTYEKLLAARKRDKVPAEDILVQDPIAKVDVEDSVAKMLDKKGIHSILEFLNTDIESTFPEKEYNEQELEALSSEQERVWKKELLAQSIEESVLIEYSGARATRYEEPEKTVTPDEFLEELIAETGINPNEAEVLDTLEVKTVRQFLDFDIDRVKDLKGYSDKIYTRLNAWQKYLRKRLPWESE